MSKVRLSLWHSKGSIKDRKAFRVVAESEGADKNIIAPVKTGQNVINIIKSQEKNSIDHIVIASHGAPTWLLNPRYGIVTNATKDSQVDVSELAKAIDIVSTDDLLVSLFVSFCSRSPGWYIPLIGARGYRKGGIKSFSGKLRDNLFYYGSHARVRGYRGNVQSALLAEHALPPNAPCSTLFRRSLPNISPSFGIRYWWRKNVSSELAQSWLLGDDSVESQISDMYNEYVQYE